MGMKQKWPTQNQHFAKILEIGPWISRIDWCQGH
jgi:hypothetical protein